MSTPHDSLVKYSLGDKFVAIDFFRAHLPADLQKRIDLESIKLTDKEFIAPHLRRLQSDIVYSCEIDQQSGYLYCLVEHQSTADSCMALRQLEYTVALLREHLKQGHKKLPVVVSLCLYHGERSPYPYSTDIYDLFVSPELAKQYMFKPFQLIDLTVTADDEIIKHGLASMLELLLKHHRTKSIVRFFRYLIKH